MYQYIRSQWYISLAIAGNAGLRYSLQTAKTPNILDLIMLSWGDVCSVFLLLPHLESLATLFSRSSMRRQATRPAGVTEVITGVAKVVPCITFIILMFNLINMSELVRTSYIGLLLIVETAVSKANRPICQSGADFLSQR